jgi:hypothetical protein
VVALFRGIDLGDDAGRIICADFGGTGTPWPGTDFVPRRHEFDGFEAGRVVGSDGRGDDVQQSRSSWSDSNGSLGPDERGTEVQ